MNDTLATLIETYNWQASLITLAGIILIVKIGKFFAFKVSALAKMRDINHAQDTKKLEKQKYRTIVKSSQKVGLVANLAFFIVVLPFCVSTTPQPIWQIVLYAITTLMVYDFFYYLCHRFWFHGNGKMRQIHAVHHQARKPTHIDAFYVHPTETLIGILLYMASIPLLVLLLGPFHVGTVILTFIIFTQVNTINHTFVDLPYFPFKTLSWITAKHHVHHENMHKGNYATITPIYDKLFGTID